MPDLCPGSGEPPYEFVPRRLAMRLGKKMVDSYGTCFWCRKVLYITSGNVLHAHKGLPRMDGCPYHCPGPQCDFNCYFPETSHA